MFKKAKNPEKGVLEAVEGEIGVSGIRGVLGDYRYYKVVSGGDMYLSEYVGLIEAAGFSVEVEKVVVKRCRLVK